MQEMFNDFMEYEVSIGALIGLMVFSFFIGLFLFVVFETSYKIPFKKYSLVICPVIVLLAYFVQKPLAAVVVIALFILTFILTLLGKIIVAPLLSAKNRIINQRKQEELAFENNPNTIRKKSVKDKKWFLEGLSSILFVLISLGSFAFLGFLGPVLVIVFSAIISKRKRGGNIMKIQKTLPTSKIRSVAMGLAEIKGRIVIDEPLVSRIENRKCAGYYYMIQEISYDDDGKEQLSTIYTDFAHNPFYLEDETGKIKVIPEKLQLLHFNEKSYRSSGKKYSEFILEEDKTDYLMIGKAAVIENERVFTYDENKQILSITPEKAIEKHDEIMYYVNKAKPYLYVFLLWIAFVLSSNVRLTSSGLSITPHEYLRNPWGILKKESKNKIEENKKEPVYYYSD